MSVRVAPPSAARGGGAIHTERYQALKRELEEFCEKGPQVRTPLMHILTATRGRTRDAGADPRRPATRRHAPVPPKARTRDRYTRVVPAHTRVSFRSHRRLFLSRVPCFFPASRGFAPSRKTSLTQPNSDPTSPRRRPRSTTRLRRYTTPRRRATFLRSARFCELARGLTSATPRARPL